MNFSSPSRVNNNSSLLMHRNLYKSPGGHCAPATNASPSWRDAYKKKCFDEFKKSRQKLLTRFRNFKIDDDAGKLNTLKDYLDEELGKICLLQAANTNEFVSYEEAMEIYKQIQVELQASAGANQLEYDYEDELLQQAAVSVTCPLCQKCQLTATSNESIDCSNCSMKLNTRKNSTRAQPLTLESLSIVLNEAVREHNCAERPCFQLVTDEDSDTCDNAVLIMSCDACNYMKVLF